MPPQDDYLFEDTFTDTNWLEEIAVSRTDTISRDRSACTVTIITDYSRYKNAIRFVLGYSWVDENYRLRRECPIFHPVWNWLFARAVTSVEFAKATGKETSEWEHAVPNATYTYARITIEFCEVRYDVLRDDEVEEQSTPSYGFKEWTRHVEQLPQPYVDLAQIDGGQLLAYAPGIGSPVNGARYTSAPHILARQEKSAFTLVWREVPAEFLYDEDGFAPKLQAMQKRVNETEFLGRIPGTLLCESIKAEKMPAPIITDVFDGLSFTYDVHFEMKEFNPDRGDTTVDKYGWNLLPGCRTASSGGNRTWAYYYYTHDGTSGGKPQFESYDFFKVFRHQLLS